MHQLVVEGPDRCRPVERVHAARAVVRAVKDQGDGPARIKGHPLGQSLLNRDRVLPILRAAAPEAGAAIGRVAALVPHARGRRGIWPGAAAEGGRSVGLVPSKGRGDDDDLPLDDLQRSIQGTRSGQETAKQKGSPAEDIGSPGLPPRHPRTNKCSTTATQFDRDWAQCGNIRGEEKSTRLLARGVSHEFRVRNTIQTRYTLV